MSSVIFNFNYALLMVSLVIETYPIPVSILTHNVTLTNESWGWRQLPPWPWSISRARRTWKHALLMGVLGDSFG